MSNKKVEAFDLRVILFLRKYSDELGRIALFIIFFWFGILKVFLISPAGPLVVDLLEVTFLSFIGPETFLILFGIFEMIVGTMILIPKIERITFAVLVLHLATTVMPLFLLPHITWYGVFAPTLIGQYIMKNMAILALGLFLFARLRPMTETHSFLGQEEDSETYDN